MSPHSKFDVRRPVGMPRSRHLCVVMLAAAWLGLISGFPSFAQQLAASQKPNHQEVPRLSADQWLDTADGDRGCRERLGERLARRTPLTVP